MTFTEWVQYGMEQGFILPAMPHSGKVYETCWTHDGVSMTPDEEAQFEEGQDPCLYILRLNPNP